MCLFFIIQMSTLQDLRIKTRNEYIKIDPSGKIRGDTTLDALINRAYFQVQKDWQHRRPQQQAEYSFNTNQWLGEYPLPSDFIKMDIPLYNYNPLSKTEKSTLKKVLNWSFSQWKPFSYYLFWSNIGLYPVPNTSGTIEIGYMKKLPKLTTSQGSLLPDDFDDAICIYAAYLAFNSVTKIDKASIMRSDYNEILSSLLTSYIYNDMNINYGYQNTGGYTTSDLNTNHVF